MAETIGTITNIKLSSFLGGTVNAFDTCMVTLLEASSSVTWLFLLWNSRDDAPGVERRSRETQRLALAREAGVPQRDGAPFHRGRFQHRRRYPGRLHLTFLVASARPSSRS